VAEYRRGVDPADIFSIAFSPKNTRMAVTSDKSTLHIFDLPPDGQEIRPHSSSHASQRSLEKQMAALSTSPKSGADAEWDAISADDQQAASSPKSNKPRWGPLAEIPGMPRIFTDSYSTVSTHFEMGEEPEIWQTVGSRPGKRPTANAPIPGSPSGRPKKGVVAWINEDELVVVGAGLDARWEKFQLGMTKEGKRVCTRLGWRRYTG